MPFGGLKVAFETRFVHLVIAYVHALQLGPARRFRERLDGLFSKVEVSPVVWKNFPPAVAYYCIR